MRTTRAEAASQRRWAGAFYVVGSLFLIFCALDLGALLIDGRPLDDGFFPRASAGLFAISAASAKNAAANLIERVVR